VISAEELLTLETTDLRLLYLGD